MKQGIAYYRVSTKRQGASGLGLEAQRLAVRQFAALYNYEIVEECIEIESGKKAKRPILLDGLKRCSKLNATLLIAKLDRLGRNVAFISRLIESKVDFVAVDNPTANTFMIHIMAAFAEYERKENSKRTKAALAVAKANGVKLGTYATSVLSVKNKEMANKFATALVPVLRDLKQNGKTTVRAITAELNIMGIKTASGQGKWHITTVQNLIKRLEAQNQKTVSDLA